MKKRRSLISVLLVLIDLCLIVSLFINRTFLVFAKELEEQPTVQTVEIIDADQILTADNDMVNYQVAEGENVRVTRREARMMEKERLAALERREEEKRQAAILAAKTIETQRRVSSDDITIHTELGVMNTVTADDINTIINYWAGISGSNVFTGQGQTFIDASKETGLDPIYILAHAGLESSWGKSAIARDKYNYFGIAAYDNSPYSSSYNMATSVSDGILAGARWIKSNYYNNGQTTLYLMRYNNGNHEYCTSSTWAPDISSIMRRSYLIIKK